MYKRQVSIDVDSVTDLAPEFTVTAPAGTIFVLDDTQAPVLMGVAGGVYTFRYWYSGTFAGSATALTLTFIGQSYDYLDSANTKIGNFANFSAIVQQEGTDLFVVVPFGESAQLDTGTVAASDITLSAGNKGAFTARGPPAFSATFPPMVHQESDAGSGG